MADINERVAVEAYARAHSGQLFLALSRELGPPPEGFARTTYIGILDADKAPFLGTHCVVNDGTLEVGLKLFQLPSALEFRRKELDEGGKAYEFVSTQMLMSPDCRDTRRCERPAMELLIGNDSVYQWLTDCGSDSFVHGNFGAGQLALVLTRLGAIQVTESLAPIVTYAFSGLQRLGHQLHRVYD